MNLLANKLVMFHFHYKKSTFDIDKHSHYKAMQTPEQKIKELEEKLKSLRLHNQYLETCFN